MTLGTLVGVLPGVGPALTVALLLPVTFSLEPVAAFIMFAGIYYGGMYGGSTTAILLNTPGESASIMTARRRAPDGARRPRRRRTGDRGDRLVRRRHAGDGGAHVLGAGDGDVALRFGPAEYFALTVLAFVAVTAVLGDSIAAAGWSACSSGSRWGWSASIR